MKTEMRDAAWASEGAVAALMMWSVSACTITDLHGDDYGREGSRAAAELS